MAQEFISSLLKFFILFTACFHIFTMRGLNAEHEYSATDAAYESLTDYKRFEEENFLKSNRTTSSSFITERFSSWEVSSVTSTLFKTTSDLRNESVIQNVNFFFLITYLWNKRSTSIGSYSWNYCNRTCRDGEDVSFSPINSQCPEIECFQCLCIRPRCEAYNLCCPDSNHHQNSNLTTVGMNEDFETATGRTYTSNHTKLISQFEDVFETPNKHAVSSDNSHYSVSESDDRSWPKFRCDVLSYEKSVLYIRSCSSTVQVSDFVISSCEQDVVDEDNAIDSKIRVVDGLKGAVYYNKFCATCNGVLEPLRWEVGNVNCRHYMYLYSATTPEEFLRKALLENSSCFVEQSPPVGTQFVECDPKWYSDEMIDECNRTGLWPEYDEDVERGCKMSSDLVDRVYDTPRYPAPEVGQLYKNLFCAICNKDSYPEYMFKCLLSGNFGSDRRPDLPFSMLLNFRTDASSSDVEDKIIITCGDNEWISPDGHCLQLHCSPGKLFVNGTCKTALERISGLGYHLRLWYSGQIENVTGGPNDNVSLLLAGEIITRFYEALRQKMSPLIQGYTLHFGTMLNVSRMKELYRTSEIPDSSHSSTSRETWPQSPDQTITTHETTTEGFKDIPSIQNTQISHIFWVKGYITASINQIRDDFEKILIEDFLDENVDLKISEKVNASFTPAFMWHAFDPETYCIGIERVFSDIDCYLDPMTRIDGWSAELDDIHDLFLNCTKLLNCPYVSFELSQYRIQNKVTVYPPTVLVTINLNGTEIIISTEPDLRMVAVDRTGKLNVCRELLDEKLPLRSRVGLEVGSLWTVQYVLTLVCVSVSMACLMLALVTYAIFPVLRNLPGINNICLCFSLLLGQAASLAVVHLRRDTVACTLVGILYHYLWLCILCWSLICCFHMFRVFTTKTRASYITSRSRNFQLVKNIIFALLTPAIIVVVVVVAMHLISHGASVGYGGNVCYLNSAKLVGASMVAPLILVTLLNLTFLIVTVIHIHRVRVIQKQNSFKSNDLRDLYVYIKLSSMTGGFWLVYIMAEGLNSDPLRIIAIILNGLQGVFIFISYICNKRVITLYLTRLGIRKPETFQSGSVTETNSTVRLNSRIQ